MLRSVFSTFIQRSPAEEQVEVLHVKVKRLVLPAVLEGHRRRSLEPAVDFTISLRHLVTHNVSLELE